ncbi:hypothetical protein RCK87_26685, partial [Salmonella enterica subsp. enterica serovar 1,4,[5],12:i:-]
LVLALSRCLSWRDLAAYIPAQVVGGILGTLAAHVMFGLPLAQASTHIRTGGPQWVSEAIAAFGLVVTILTGLRFQTAALP